MKKILLIIGLCPLFLQNVNSQEISTKSLDSAEMYSMQEADVKFQKGQRYFLKKSDKPYTGFLYARYDNGELEALSQVVDGICNGIWINYSPDGKKECQGTYIDNRVEGPVTFFYEDGSVKSEGQYRDWKRPIGKWTFYDRAGNVVSTRVYTP